MGMSESAPLAVPKRVGGGGGLELEAMVLKEENLARILPSRIFAVRFFPSSDRTAVVVGDKLGNVGFWDVDFAADQGNGIYTYSLHSAPVSEVVVHPFSLHKVWCLYILGDLLVCILLFASICLPCNPLVSLWAIANMMIWIFCSMCRTVLFVLNGH